MSRFLFAPMPFTGHVNPGLPIARELVARGHDVRWYSTYTDLRSRAEALRYELAGLEAHRAGAELLEELTGAQGESSWLASA